MNRTIHAAFCAVAFSTAGCGVGHNFVSPVVAQEPRSFQAPGDIVQGPIPDGPSAPGVPDALPGKPQSLSFYRTQDSSDWVAHTFKVQSKYGRVIAVTAGAPPTTVSVGTLDLKGRPAVAVSGRGLDPIGPQVAA